MSWWGWNHCFHLIVTIVVISTHCATVWGHCCIGMIRVMVVSTDACGECLHCQSSLSSWLLLVVVSGDEDGPHVVLVMFVSSSYQSWLSCPFVIVVALHWHQASHVIIPSLFSWYYYVHCHCFCVIVVVIPCCHFPVLLLHCHWHHFIIAVVLYSSRFSLGLMKYYMGSSWTQMVVPYQSTTSLIIL